MFSHFVYWRAHSHDVSKNADVQHGYETVDGENLVAYVQSVDEDYFLDVS